MKRHQHLPLEIIFAGLLLAASQLPAADAREVIVLDGRWELAEGTMAARPQKFPRTVPVPGIVSLATPPLERPPSVIAPGHEDVHPAITNPARRQDLLKQRSSAGYEAFWYRKEVVLPGPVPEVARLKVNKSRWGVAAWVNGQPVGEHLRIRTAGVFDVAGHLKGNGAKNEIVLRIGGRMDALPNAIPKANPWAGTTPGLYDSVSLILSGSPSIVRVQAVPDLKAGSVGLAVLVRNGSAARQVSVQVTVREDAAGKLTGQSKPVRLSLAPGEEKTVEITVSLANYRTWSPETPFLYRFDVTVVNERNQAVTDRLADRFGMREFRIDPSSGKATLNGKHVLLRGAGVLNVTDTMERPGIGTRPWEEAWVRQAWREVKRINGNAARSAFDFMPEIWYRLADEEGILIQDEALSNPPPEVAVETLIALFAEWIHERANHASVVIWDASNETSHDRGGAKLKEAIAATRALDLSHRPWDNSWDPTGLPGDVSYEKHVYQGWLADYTPAGLGPRLRGLLSADKIPPGFIMNEFCGVFLRPDGTPSGYSKKFYETFMVPGSTAADRFVVRGRLTAMEVEIWRRFPGIIGVMWNPFLHASERQVVNDFERPAIEAEFVRFVRDASATVGVMLDFWDDKVRAARAKEIAVSVANDSTGNWSGAVRLRLLRAGRNLSGTTVFSDPPRTEEAVRANTLQEWSGRCSTASGSKCEVGFEIAMPGEPGHYLLAAEIAGPDGMVVRSWRDFRVEK